jgi:hypothetical protein
MPNLVIFSPRFIDNNGNVVKPRLTLWADNCFNYYKAYPYFAANLSNKKTPQFGIFKESTCEELLARSRRVILFSDISRLQPKKYSVRKFGDLAERVYKAGSCDHVSFWVSFWGTKFALNEPYHTDPAYFMRLGAEGLVAIELPLDISPYSGGGWSTKAGEKPWTKSYLICDVNDLHELEGLLGNYFERIEVCFEGHSAEEIDLVPAWNSLEGITHA